MVRLHQGGDTAGDISAKAASSQEEVSMVALSSIVGFELIELFTRIDLRRPNDGGDGEVASVGRVCSGAVVVIAGCWIRLGGG